MDQTCAIFGGDKIAKHDIMRGLIRRQEGEERMIFHTLQFLALECLKDFYFFIPKDFFHQDLARISFSLVPLLSRSTMT